MLYIVLALLGAYLLGSIPTALWVGRWFCGLPDIREHGSGNAGATNTFRVLGKRPGTAVLLIDAFKGFAAAYFLPNWPAGCWRWWGTCTRCWRSFAAARGWPPSWA